MSEQTPEVIDVVDPDDGQQDAGDDLLQVGEDFEPDEAEVNDDEPDELEYDEEDGEDG